MDSRFALRPPASGDGEVVDREQVARVGPVPDRPPARLPGQRDEAGDVVFVGILRVDRFPRREVEALAVDRDRLRPRAHQRSEEHTSELQSLMRISYAVFCLKKKKKQKTKE